MQQNNINTAVQYIRQQNTAALTRDDMHRTGECPDEAI